MMSRPALPYVPAACLANAPTLNHEESVWLKDRVVSWRQHWAIEQLTRLRDILTTVGGRERRAAVGCKDGRNLPATSYFLEEGIAYGRSIYGQRSDS